MSTKHTPGPWNEDGVFVCDDEDNIICELYEINANAQLIAAAPELLQALVNLVQALQPDENGQISLSDVEFVETEARGVIYKVTGEEA